MIKTVFVPLISKLQATDRVYLRSQGKETEFLQKLHIAMEQETANLNEALNSGYTVIHAEKVEDSRAVYFTYMLYKPDPVVDPDRVETPFMDLLET